MGKKKSKNNSKKASKERKEARREARAFADNHHQMLGKTARELCEGVLTPESRRLLAQLQRSSSPQEASRAVRALALLAGTDVAANDRDAHGDGDQSLVATDLGEKENSTMMARFAAMGASAAQMEGFAGEPARQILRHLFALGGDLEQHLEFRGFSPFATSCCMGDARAVETALRGTAEGSEERRHLLERRESGMRFSPLLLAILIPKTKPYVCQLTGAKEADMDHVGVVKTLLRYGARPNCKELTGKSAVHYGAGCRANDESLKMTDYVIEASKSCFYFGQPVVLRNLNKVEYNGLSGVLGGFDADTGRRQVTLDNKKQLSLQPKNIFSVTDKVCIYDPLNNLLNEPDRVGTISLNEVVLSTPGRVDVAKFLIERKVSVDITPPCGNSVRKLVDRPTSPFGPTKMQDVIRKYIVDIEKTKDSHCWSCGKVGEELFKCARCQLALYCSKQCQKTHWCIHKADCQVLDETYSIQLSRPPARVQAGISGRYQRPDGVDVDEQFWIKVQCDLWNSGPHLVYDRSRSCHFYIMPDTAGYLELLDKMKDARVFGGQKLFFKAAFDGSGNCRVYPNMSSISKKW